MHYLSVCHIPSPVKPFFYTLIVLLLAGFRPSSDAQTIPAWDNPAGQQWPEGFQTGSIPSSLDSTHQKAILFRAEGNDPRPLVISLHTWSSDYTQADPIAAIAARNNWNYIHPDFRGMAVTPKACGSRYVISDLEDVIDFSLKYFRMKSDDIHIIGVSGGGYTGLVAYMKVRRPVASFSVWVPISNLCDWYWESAGRENKYAGDLVNVSGGDSLPDFNDLKQRSPVFLDFDDLPNPDATLEIYTGASDGYTGSVPVTQSIDFYNLLVRRMGADSSAQVANHEILNILAMRCMPRPETGRKISGRTIYIYRAFRKVSLTVFEGTHEMLPETAAESVNKK